MSAPTALPPATPHPPPHRSPPPAQRTPLSSWSAVAGAHPPPRHPDAVRPGQGQPVPAAFAAPPDPVASPHGPAGSCRPQGPGAPPGTTTRARAPGPRQPSGAGAAPPRSRPPAPVPATPGRTTPAGPAACAPHGLVRAAPNHRHTVRTFTPPAWAPARTCADVNAPAASSSSNRATSTGLAPPTPTRPHPTHPAPPPRNPSARARPTRTTVPPRNPRKDQKYRSRDSGTGRGVPDHDSHARPRYHPMSVTTPSIKDRPVTTHRPDVPSLTPPH